jgi:hypothetical protein
MGLSSHFSTILGTGITPGINENLITQVYGRPIHAFDLTDLIKGVVMI